jgi:hypothetical protein
LRFITDIYLHEVGLGEGFKAFMKRHFPELPVIRDQVAERWVVLCQEKEFDEIIAELEWVRRDSPRSGERGTL